MDYSLELMEAGFADSVKEKYPDLGAYAQKNIGAKRFKRKVVGICKSSTRRTVEDIVFDMMTLDIVKSTPEGIDYLNSLSKSAQTEKFDGPSQLFYVHDRGNKRTYLRFVLEKIKDEKQFCSIYVKTVNMINEAE